MAIKVGINGYGRIGRNILRALYEGGRKDIEIVAQVVDSTCGFNQVIIAAKALVEHGIELNVVADHA